MLAETLNLLNEKGLRYKAVPKDGTVACQFGVAVSDVAKGKVSKEVIEVVPKAEAVSVTFLGKEKAVDQAGLAGFIDGVLKLKAIQEEEAKLIAELSA